MSSYVFYKFRNQKEDKKIDFDGADITVFELKGEIIKATGMGEGKDIDFSIFEDENFKREYDDDTATVPKASMVWAKRKPAARPGRGNAARYVSGRAPIKNAYRSESAQRSSSLQNGTAAPASISKMANAETEEEKFAALQAADAASWNAKKQEMANAKPVFHSRPGRPPNVPDHPPPKGYVCHRCHEQGHWIQECPTNNDPNYESKPKIRKTTGIPTSMLKTVEKPVAKANDGRTDETLPTGVMMNAKGEYVQFVPDTAAFEKFQAVVKDSKEKQAALEEQEEAEKRKRQNAGVDCDLDVVHKKNHLLSNPVKTPCCGKTYCRECIEYDLQHHGRTCPSCFTEDVSIDNLAPDEEAAAKVKAYEDKKSKEREARRESTKSPTPPAAKSPRKRAAEDELKNERKPPTGPAAMRNNAPSQPNGDMADFVKQMNAMAGMNGMPPMPPPMAMSMPMNMNMPMMPMNPMMAGFPQPFGCFPNMNMGGGFNNFAGGNAQMNWQQYQQPGWQGGNQGNWQGGSMMGNGGIVQPNKFNAAAAPANDEDSAYERRPVNPHRHQRGKRPRPFDYREL